MAPIFKFDRKFVKGLNLMSSSSRETVSFLSRQPHLMFWLSIPFVLIIGYSSVPQISVIWDDQSLVISSKEIAFIISSYYLVLGLIYAQLIRSGKRMITFLTIVHLFCTLDLGLLFWIVYLFLRTNQNGMISFDLSGLPVVILGIMVLGQIFFLMHLIGLILKSNSSKNIST